MCWKKSVLKISQNSQENTSGFMQVNYILFQLKPLENHDSLDKIIEYDKG